MTFLGVSIPLAGELILVAAGILYAMLIAFIQRKMFDRTIQSAIKQHQKELTAMIKGGASQEEINAKQSILMQHMKKSMGAQLKFMVVVLPLLYIIYQFVLPALPMLGPNASSKILINFVLFKLTFTQAGWLFIVTATLFGLLLSSIVAMWDRKTEKKKLAAQQMGTTSV